jgi:hypothetical protein
MTADLTRYEFFPALFAEEQLGLRIYEDQAPIFDPDIRRGIVNCCRQWGKTTVVGARAFHHALYTPKSLTLIVAPSARQSSEFILKLEEFALMMNIKPRGDGHNENSLKLPNGSRIVGLPANKDTSRGFSRVSLLLVDEASRVEDNLFNAIVPSTAAHEDPTIWLMSTPNGRQGFFYRFWFNQESAYTRISVPATECPRIKPGYLEEQRLLMPERDFRQEYLCEFHEPNDAVFSMDLLSRCMVDDPPCAFPSFVGGRVEDTNGYLENLIGQAHYYIGIDLGQACDYTAIAVVEKLKAYKGKCPLDYSDLFTTTYTLRHIERIPLRTSYVDIVRHVNSMTQTLLFKHNCTFIVDATGAGRPVFDMIKNKVRYCSFYSINITSGNTESQSNGVRNVPKSSLIASLQIAFETAEIRIPKSLEHLPLLMNELSHFKARIKNTGYTTMNAASGEHDDLLFAVALAVYKAIQ